MTTVRPFRALRYDPERVNLRDVLAPPYDVVAADDRGRLYDRDPHNAIRLELTRNVADEATTDYGEIRQTLDAWSAEGILRRDDTGGTTRPHSTRCVSPTTRRTARRARARASSRCCGSRTTPRASCDPTSARSPDPRPIA
jgi:hypothetical protein